MGYLALPTTLPTHDDQNENYYMMTARYRKKNIMNVVGLPLREVIDILVCYRFIIPASVEMITE